MLTVRSRILIGIAGVAIVAPIYRYIAEGGTWLDEPGDWYAPYVGWVVSGVLILAAVLSVIIDVRKDRTSS